MKPYEIEITDIKGNKHYEIAYDIYDCWKLMRLHNGVSFKKVED